VFSVDGSRTEGNIRVNPALRLVRGNEASGLPTCIEIENRTHQSEKEMKVCFRLCDKEYDIHNLYREKGKSSRQFPSSDSRARAL
jgi:hypothetical protein